VTAIDGINMKISDYGYLLTEEGGFFELYRAPFKHPIIATEDTEFLSGWLDKLIRNLPVGHC